MEADTNWAGGLQLMHSLLLWNKFGVKFVSAGPSPAITGTAAMITDNWILGLSPHTGASIGISIDTYSGRGTTIKGNDIEGWGTGIFDDSSFSNSFVGNRFEANINWDIQITQTNSNDVILGNAYANAPLVSYPAHARVLQVSPDTLYMGGTYALESAAVLWGSSPVSGPQVGLWHSYETTAHPLFRAQALARNATPNLFSEAITTREVDLVGDNTPLKIGTIGAYGTTLYSNSVPRVAVTPTGVILNSDPAIAPVHNGDITLSVGTTTLTITAKGTDGVVRSTALTLA
jgi:hypothetical protein